MPHNRLLPSDAIAQAGGRQVGGVRRIGRSVQDLAGRRTLPNLAPSSSRRHLCRDRRPAAINYVNHGSYATPGGLKDITWLEIVTLRRTGAEWRIDFINSQVQSDPAEHGR